MCGMSLTNIVKNRGPKLELSPRCIKYISCYKTIIYQLTYYCGKQYCQLDCFLKENSLSTLRLAPVYFSAIIQFTRLSGV